MGQLVYAAKATHISRPIVLGQLQGARPSGPPVFCGFRDAAGHRAGARGA